jgi:dihydroorotate dehydrogenase
VSALVVKDRKTAPVGIWKLARPFAFMLDAEHAHELGLSVAKALAMSAAKHLPDDDVARSPTLARSVMGLHFPNPLGLAAGLDKNAVAVPFWQSLGFGFVEVGTVTAHAQPGNDRPRLFRLPDDGALLNRMGFNNEGAAVVGERLARMREAGSVEIPVGVNLGKSKVTPASEAADDYRASFRACAPFSDYVVVNVSSPNTPGLRDLQKVDELSRILDAVLDENARLSTARPVLVKLAPDLSFDDADDAARLARDRAVHGLILTNTTLDRTGLVGPVPEGTGGISGAPLFARSTDMLAHVARTVDGALTLIGVGGIKDGATARAKLDAGAALIQLYTAFVYAGPGLVRAILRALVSDGTTTTR